MSFFEIIKMNCQQATCLHTKHKEDKLSFTEKLGLKIHLAYCSLCRLFFEQADAIEKQSHLLSNTATQSSALTPGQKEKLKKQLSDLEK